MRDATHITLLCDRTGSMGDKPGMKEEAENGVNHLIDEHKKVPGDCTLLLVDFDSTEYRKVYLGPIADCPRYTLEPRSMTPLFDSLGRAITETGDYLRSMPEDQRPDKVLFAYQTDGLENASQEWKLDQVRRLIKTQEDEFNWQFLALGTGPDTWNQAADLGITNVTRGVHTNASMGSTYSYAADVSTGWRAGIKGMDEANAYVDEEGTVIPDEES